MITSIKPFYKLYKPLNVLKDKIKFLQKFVSKWEIEFEKQFEDKEILYFIVSKFVLSKTAQISLNLFSLKTWNEEENVLKNDFHQIFVKIFENQEKTKIFSNFIF